MYIALNEPEFEGRHRFGFAADSTLSAGQHVVFMGFPFQMSNMTGHSGYVSSLFQRNGVSLIQIDGSVNGGNSGGPLLNLADGSVAGIVTRAHVGFVADQFDNLIAALRNNVEVLGQQRGSISIGGLARGFKGRVGLPVFRKWEGFEAVGGSVAQVILHRGPEEPRPDLVRTGLESAEGGVSAEGKDRQRMREDSIIRLKCKCKVWSGSTIHNEYSRLA